MALLMDYDGANQQQLVSIAGTTQLYFSSNYETAYRLNAQDGSAVIQAVPLVATTN
jgi:hypothetical protein